MHTWLTCPWISQPAGEAEFFCNEAEKSWCGLSELIAPHLSALFEGSSIRIRKGNVTAIQQPDFTKASPLAGNTKELLGSNVATA